MLIPPVQLNPKGPQGVRFGALSNQPRLGGTRTIASTLLPRPSAKVATDSIIYDIGSDGKSAGGFGQPHCLRPIRREGKGGVGEKHLVTQGWYGGQVCAGLRCQHRGIGAPGDQQAPSVGTTGCEVKRDLGWASLSGW